MKNSLILVVDDNTDNIAVIEELLRYFGFRFNSTTESTEILDVLEYQAPDMILLDLYMPEQDGLETLKIIKKNKKYASIPVIMLTAETDKKVLSKCLKEGAMDYLTKPINQIELEARMRSALRISGLNMELKKKNEEIHKFVGMIVHDLKNPLAIITGYLGYINMLLEEAKYDKIEKCIDLISKSASNMKDSINEMLDVNRIQRGELNLKFVTENPMPYINFFLVRMNMLSEKKSIAIKNNEIELPEVQFDEKRLREVMDNLVSNSIKYSDAGKTINIDYEVSKSHLKILIKDEGQGMTENDLYHVFKDFQKLSARPTGGESSTGLGLAIVKKVVEAMGGEVGVYSDGKNKGSTFWFTLKR